MMCVHHIKSFTSSFSMVSDILALLLLEVRNAKVSVALGIPALLPCVTFSIIVVANTNACDDLSARIGKRNTP